MPLFKKNSRFQVNPDQIKKKFAVPMTRLALTRSNISDLNIYHDVCLLCQASIKARTEPFGSFMVFGMVMGENAEDKKTADAIWEQCWQLFNGDDNPDEVFDFLRKVLGTILMIEVCKDDGIWEFEPDPDKAIKNRNGETPDAVIYNLRKPR